MDSERELAREAGLEPGLNPLDRRARLVARTWYRSPELETVKHEPVGSPVDTEIRGSTPKSRVPRDSPPPAGDKRSEPSIFETALTYRGVNLGRALEQVLVYDLIPLFAEAKDRQES